MWGTEIGRSRLHRHRARVKGEMKSGDALRVEVSIRPRETRGHSAL
jgi:hypothetical protein